MDTSDVTVETFAGREGQTFAIRFDDGTYELTLASIDRMPEEWGRTDVREPFSVTFEGPVEHLLPQNTWTLEHDELGPTEVFLVPLGPAGAEGPLRYQAVFT